MNDDLQQFTEDELRIHGAKMIADADQGIQTAIVTPDGKVRAVVGLNCVRFLPNANPDPLEEFMWEALKSKAESEKQ